MNYLKTVVAFLQAHWVTVIAVGTVLYGIDKPYITAYIATHPAAALIYANIAAVVAFYTTSPLTKKSA